jgi:hypothetical protein
MAHFNPGVEVIEQVMIEEIWPVRSICVCCGERKFVCQSNVAATLYYNSTNIVQNINFNIPLRLIVVSQNSV